MYYCAVHQVAYPSANQWVGHWLNAHRDETRPKAEEVFVEQVPEGTRVAPPPAPKPVSRRAPPPPPPPGSGDGLPRTPPPPAASAYEDEDERHLDQLLDGIGVAVSQRQTIVKGWRIFPVLHQHPSNLENHILGIVGPKFRGQVPLVVHAMFPGAEQEASIPQYMYEQPRYGRQAPMFLDGRRPSPYQRDWEYEGPPPDYRYYRSAPPVETAAASPEVVELRKQVDGILGEFQAERAERAKERLEQQEKERDVAWQAQLGAVSAKVDTAFKEISDVVKGLVAQIQLGRGDAEVSQTQLLAEKVETLNKTISDQREAQLRDTVEGLRGELGDVRQKLNAEPTGKTTEDLLSQGLPLAIAELRNVGGTVTSELKGIRQQAADGKLPSLTPPVIPGAKDQAGSADPVNTAQQIVGARALEDEILTMAAGQGRG